MISIVSPRMLNLVAFTQYKSLNTVGTIFARASKHVIVDFEPTTEEEHLLDGSEKEKTVKHKVEAKKKKGLKRVTEMLEEATIGDEKSSYSSEFDDVFEENYNVLSWRSQRL